MDIRERYQWKRVQAPKPWRPKELDAELVGFFGGTTIRNGAFGQYEVALVHVPSTGSLMISGSKVLQLIAAAQIRVGWPVRIVWKGTIPLSNGRAMKDYEVFVAEGDPVSAEDLPLVNEPSAPSEH